MTAKEIQDIVIDKHQQEHGAENMEKLIKKLRGRPFWIWSNREHGYAMKSRGRPDHPHPPKQCCFNCVIGWPRKNGEERPIYNFQRQIYKALFDDVYLNKRSWTPEEFEELRLEQIELETRALKDKHMNVEVTKNDFLKRRQERLTYPFKNKHVWIKKSTGIGATEFLIRVMVWLATRDNQLSGTNMCITTGPRVETSIGIIRRIKKLFEPHGIFFDSKQTTVNINGVNITAYPSAHTDDMRSLTDVSFILIDEADFYSPSEQSNVRSVAERYIGKTDPWIAMISTPNTPGGLFEQIEKESFDTCIYKKLILLYHEALGTLYSHEEIENVKHSLSFPREYLGQYIGLQGNVFTPQSIEKITVYDYSPETIVPGCIVSVGLDPAFGSSRFGVVVTRFANNRIEVLEADEIERPDIQDMIDVVWNLKTKYGNLSAIHVDAAMPVVWQPLKRLFNEMANEKYVFDRIRYCETHNIPISRTMRVIPITFSNHHTKLLQHLKMLVDGGYLAVHPKFTKLLTAMRTAYATELKYDKSGSTSQHTDVFDALRLAVQVYNNEE